MDLLGDGKSKSCIDCADDCHRVPLLGVDEVGEEYRVPDEDC